MARFGVLITKRTSRKAVQFLNALHKSAVRLGIDVAKIEHYEPCDVLVLYGLGGEDRQAAVKEHGGTFIAWDLGYWNRFTLWRFSFNDYHPTADVMRGQVGRRLELPVTDRGGNPSGPIMLIGNGPKSNAVGAAGWASHKSLEIRAAYPDKKIVYRPKPKRPIEPGVLFDSLSYGPIELELRKVSLVVCRHSNVAVDACFQGVPVVCDAGAASLIYPQRFDGEQPSPEERREFLNRLSWWQYSAGEVDLAWQFIQGRLCK